MKVLITGASGFLGRSVVQIAAAKHQVVALVRPAADISAYKWPANVQIVRGDLRQEGKWCSETDGIEGIIHLAAAPTGSFAEQFTGTVVATENLLARVALKSLKRFVHVSSFSVYDFAALPAGAVLSEAAPIETRPESRDPYTITKILQEHLIVEACKAAETPYVILRPGAIYGPGKAWNYGRAFRLGRFDILFSPGAEFRLTFVDNCAGAIVRSLDAPIRTGSIFNIVDDDLPSHRGYYQLCRRAGASTGWPIYVPWFIISGTGRIIGFVNSFVFGGRARLPELFAHRRQQARWKPLRYTNDHTKAALGWLPMTSFEEGTKKAVASRQE
jgi:nucleoside-diphosphate-sugar epimerase